MVGVLPNCLANCTPKLLSMLNQLDLGFTFTSKPELSALYENGTDLSSAVFANSVKLGSHLRAAQACGVSTVYLDSVQELSKIKKFHPSARLDQPTAATFRHCVMKGDWTGAVNVLEELAPHLESPSSLMEMSTYHSPASVPSSTLHCTATKSSLNLVAGSLLLSLQKLCGFRSPRLTQVMLVPLEAPKTLPKIQLGPWTLTK